MEQPSPDHRRRELRRVRGSHRRRRRRRRRRRAAELVRRHVHHPGQHRGCGQHHRGRRWPAHPERRRQQALAFVSVQQIDENTFRYSYTGTLSTGTVTVAFNAGTWTDARATRGPPAARPSASSPRAPRSHRALRRHHARGGRALDEPLIDLSANRHPRDRHRPQRVQADLRRTAVDHQARHGRRNGRGLRPRHGRRTLRGPAVLGRRDPGDQLRRTQAYGLDLYAKGTLQINLTGETKTETITLPGLGGGGSDLTRTFELAPYSFGLELVGQVLVSVPGGGPELLRVNGGFFLDIAASAEPHFTMFFTGSVSIGSGAAQLSYGQTTGLLLIDGDGVAGTFSVAAGGGSACRRGQHLHRHRQRLGDVQHDLEDQGLPDPQLVLPLLRPGDPTTITIFKSAPGIDGQPNPTRGLRRGVRQGRRPAYCSSAASSPWTATSASPPAASPTARLHPRRRRGGHHHPDPRLAGRHHQPHRLRRDKDRCRRSRAAAARQQQHPRDHAQRPGDARDQHLLEPAGHPDLQGQDQDLQPAHRGTRRSSTASSTTRPATSSRPRPPSPRSVASGSSSAACSSSATVRTRH